MPNKGKKQNAPKQAPAAKPQPGRKQQRKRTASAARNRGMQLARVNVNKQFGRFAGGGAMHLMHMLSLPGDVPVTRLPTVDMPRTSVLKYRRPVDHSEEISIDGATLVVVIGHPALHWMRRRKATSLGSPWTVVLHTTQLLVPDTTSRGHGTGIAHIPTTTTLVLDDVLQVASINSGSTWMPTIYHDGVQYFYANSGAKFTWVEAIHTTPVMENGTMVNYLPPTCTVHCTLVALRVAGARYGTDQLHSMLHKTTAPDDANHTADCSITVMTEGWYCIKYNFITCNHLAATPDNHTVVGAYADSISSLSVSQAKLTLGASEYWEMFPTANLATQPEMGREMRRTAASLLISNMSSEYTSQGSIRAARLLRSPPTGTASGTVSMYSALVSSAAEIHTGHARTGVYTYMSFDDVDELFSEVVCQHTSGANTIGFQVDSRYLEGGYMNVIIIKNGAYATHNNTYVITSDISLEFKGSMSDRTFAVPSGNYSDLIESRRINNATTYFYDNPIHWNTISRYLHSMWSFLRKNATTIGGAASLVFPEAAPAIMPVARFIQQ